jgi:hypothetical protein
MDPSPELLHSHKSTLFHHHVYNSFAIKYGVDVLLLTNFFRPCYPTGCAGDSAAATAPASFINTLWQDMDCLSFIGHLKTHFLICARIRSKPAHIGIRNGSGAGGWMHCSDVSLVQQPRSLFAPPYPPPRSPLLSPGPAPDWITSLSLKRRIEITYSTRLYASKPL